MDLGSNSPLRSKPTGVLSHSVLPCPSPPTPSHPTPHYATVPYPTLPHPTLVSAGILSPIEKSGRNLIEEYTWDEDAQCVDVKFSYHTAARKKKSGGGGRGGGGGGSGYGLGSSRSVSGERFGTTEAVTTVIQRASITNRLVAGPFKKMVDISFFLTLSPTLRLSTALYLATFFSYMYFDSLPNHPHNFPTVSRHTGRWTSA